MRSGTRALALVMAMAAIQAGASEGPSDVPTSHWARKDVESVLLRQVMSAPAGKFNGGAHVSRSDLIRTMAAFARSMEKGAWAPGTGRRLKPGTNDSPSPVLSKPITRYELAAVLARMGRYAAAGVPKPGPKRFGKSEAIPDAPSPAAVSKSDPLYPDFQYLVQHRMVWPKSVLAKPGSEPVTGKELASAAVAVITAQVDQTTDEPQNREEIGPPPNRGNNRVPERPDKPRLFKRP